MRSTPGRTWLLVLVLTVWAFDTFAYLSGRTFKRGRFLNHISPNKTWSGVIGGTVAAIVVAGALTWAAGPVVAGRARHGSRPRDRRLSRVTSRSRC